MPASAFRSLAARSSAAQVHEGQSDLTEAKEEAEMLRLQLDIALQDAEAARNAAATAQALAISNAASSLSPPAGPSPSNSNLDEVKPSRMVICRAVMTAGCSVLPQVMGHRDASECFRSRSRVCIWVVS